MTFRDFRIRFNLAEIPPSFAVDRIALRLLRRTGLRLLPGAARAGYSGGRHGHPAGILVSHIKGGSCSIATLADRDESRHILIRSTSLWRVGVRDVLELTIFSASKSPSLHPPQQSNEQNQTSSELVLNFVASHGQPQSSWAGHSIPTRYLQARTCQIFLAHSCCSFNFK